VTARILLAEDEQAIADAVSYALESQGHEVEVRGDGNAALAAARARSYDVLVLDVMLPGLDGIEICRRLRAESDVPILMLTARDAEVDRVLGLEAGADDYVTKPFSMVELVSRVRAILRRRELDRGLSTVIEVGGLRVDPTRHAAWVDGRVIHLTPSELQLLVLFARDPERVFSRREIMQHLWHSEYVGDERAADGHVANLRRKVEADTSQPTRIRTVRGVGYTLAVV
jgi:DNA-binding response OmpR family regulator